MTRLLLAILNAIARLRVTILYTLRPQQMADTFHERFSRLPPQAREYLLRKHGFSLDPDEKQAAKVIAHAHLEQAHGRNRDDR